MFGRKPKEIPQIPELIIHPADLPESARPAVDLVRQQNIWMEQLVDIDNRLRLLRFEAGPVDEAALTAPDSATLSDDINNLLHQKLRALADDLAKIAPAADTAGGLGDINRMVMVNGAPEDREHYNPQTGTLISAAVTDLNFGKRKLKAGRAKTAAAAAERVLTGITPEKISVINDKFNEMKILLSGAERVYRVKFAQINPKSQFHPQPLQITASEHCEQELVFYARDPNESTWADFVSANANLELLLNIEKQADECCKEIERFINTVRKELANVMTQLGDVDPSHITSDLAKQIKQEIEDQFKALKIAYDLAMRELEKRSTVLKGQENPDVQGDSTDIIAREVRRLTKSSASGESNASLAELVKLNLNQLPAIVGYRQSLDKLTRLISGLEVEIEESKKPKLLTAVESEESEFAGVFENLNETEARKLGLERMEVKSDPFAQKLMNEVINHTIDINTPAGRQHFIEQWQQNCPNTPIPCVPNAGGDYAEGNYWYLTKLSEGRIVASLTDETKKSHPHFDQNELLLVDNWQEKDFATATSQILQKLTGQSKVVEIKREDLDNALWQGDPANHQPTQKHLDLLKEYGKKFGFNPDEFEFRPIRQDEYARLAKQNNWGQQNLWTNHDGYFLGDDGDRCGLDGGYRDRGGASKVDSHWGGAAFGNLSVRLVLARKQV